MQKLAGKRKIGLKMVKVNIVYHFHLIAIQNRFYDTKEGPDYDKNCDKIWELIPEL